MANPNPQQYGIGYRQAAVGNPGQVASGRGSPYISQQVVNQQPPAQQPPAQQPQQQLPDMGQAALIKALMAQQAGQRAGRYRQGSDWASRQPDNTKAALFSGLGTFMAGRQDKKALEAMEAAAEMQADAEEAKAEEQARAAAGLVLSRGGSMEEADAIFKATKAGLKVDLKGKEGMSEEEVMKMADNIHDDTKAMMDEMRQAKVITGQLSDKILGARNGATEVLALYSFIKSIDPGSVVRPGETEMVSAASSLLNQFKVKYRNVTEDTMMSDVMYEDLTNLVRQLNDMQVKSFQRGFEYEISRATALGIPPKMVFGDEFLKDLYEGGTPSAAPEKVAKTEEPPEAPPGYRVEKRNGEWIAVPE